MTFRLHHSVTLSCPFAKAWPLFSSPDIFPSLQQCLDGCSDCKITKPPTASSSTLPLSLEQCHTLLKQTSRPTSSELLGLDWAAFDTQDASAMHFQFKLAPFGITVSGVQTIHEAATLDSSAGSRYGIVLFHSHVTSAGIEERKFRLVEAVGADSTRITETVFGTAPRVMAWTLNKMGTAEKTHTAHVEGFRKLV